MDEIENIKITVIARTIKAGIPFVNEIREDQSTKYKVQSTKYKKVSFFGNF